MKIKIIKSPVKSWVSRKEILRYIHSQDDGWSKFYNDELTRKDFSYEHWHVVAEEKGIFIGHCHVCRSFKDPWLGMVAFLEVDAGFRGHGIAKSLYGKSMEILELRGVKLAMLSTDFGNIARKHIYLKDGFTDIFVGPEGGIVMVKALGEELQSCLDIHIVEGGEKNVIRDIEYADYLMADLVMNLKLGKIRNKNLLPLNAKGIHGGYCLFRDYIQIRGKLKARDASGKIVDIILK